MSHMNTTINKRHSIALATMIVVPFAVVGCGGDEPGLARRYKVAGQVSYQGHAVPKGTITFEPVNPPLPQGRIASGTIEDGYYTLSTLAQDDGALPGEYQVVIISKDTDIKALVEKAKGGPAHHDAAFFHAVRSAKNLVPIKYSRSDTSELKAKVETRSNTIPFDLNDPGPESPETVTGSSSLVGDRRDRAGSGAGRNSTRFKGPGRSRRPR